MTKPISPEEVVQLKLEQVPDGVIRAFNEAIAEHYQGGRAEVPLWLVRNKITIHTDTPEDTIPGWWLDIEEIYRKEGWEVSFYKPDYGESWQSYFDFRKK